MSATPKLSIKIRRNWGFWDGVHARERGRLPAWNHLAGTRCRHPFDRAYGEAFWAGWYDEPHPNTGKLADYHPDRAPISEADVMPSPASVF